MKQKPRKLSIRFKILIPASLLLLAVSALIGINSYTTIKSNMIEMGMEQAQTAARMTLLFIDSNEILSIQENGTDSEYYDSVLATLIDMKEQCGIMYLYTLYTDKKDVFYTVDSDETDGQAEPGEIFEESYEELESVFNGESYVQDYIDVTEDGTLITVYEPIKDSSGNIVAVLGSDYDASGIQDTLNNTIRKIILTAAISLAFGFLLLNIIISAIMRGINSVDRKIYDLVNNEGDLTQKLELKSGDELELIAGNVNQLLEYIRTIMIKISDNSIKLTASSKEVVNQLSDTSGNVTDVSATMEEMSAAMEETSASLNQIQELLLNAANSVTQIANQASSDESFTHEISGTASEIEQSAEEARQKALEEANNIALRMKDKIEQSRSVEEIQTLTGDILGIAKQTNLLALNASIEAARAGDAGKGFAVVAEQIGSLASNSAGTASKIQEVSRQVIEAVDALTQESEKMITFITENALLGYEQLVTTAGEYKSNSAQINDTMREFNTSAASLKDIMTQIKESATAVNIAVEESAQGVTSVAELSSDIMNSVSKITNEAENNQHIAENLNTEVNRFKLQ